MTLYNDIAHQITQRIHKGVYHPGMRLPGVRHLSTQFGVSISTIVQAQRQLENSGLLEARPRSGYYVTHQVPLRLKTPHPSRPELKPIAVTGQALVLQLAQAANHDAIAHLGAAVPDASFLPLAAFQRSLSHIVRQHGRRTANYIFPPGLPELQHQIAKRMYLFGSNVDSNEVLITNGCQEAITLALQAVAQPGDTIAIESPTFYGLLQVIDALGMKALEIPTDPQEGISIPALTLALEQWTVKACVVIPNFSNPLGCLMTDDKKRQLVQLAHRHNMVLIEDDIYGDLGFSGERPRSLHSFDPLGKVIYCSSFSKTLSPGLRLGWMVAGAYFQPVEYLKYIANLAAPTMQQMAVAHYLEQNSYERYLRQAQSNYQRQVSLFTHAISKYFPANTRVTQPKGGFVLWVELDSKINALVLCQQALEARISIVPGQIFSASQKYQNFIRLNCAHPWTSTLEQALQYLGQLVFKLIETKDYWGRMKWEVSIAP